MRKWELEQELAKARRDHRIKLDIVRAGRDEYKRVLHLVQKEIQAVVALGIIPKKYYRGDEILWDLLCRDAEDVKAYRAAERGREIVEQWIWFKYTQLGGNMETIIENVEDLQEGDIATFVFRGYEYSGPVHKSNGKLMFMDHAILYDDGFRPVWTGNNFVTATRELPALPTEPLSVITDVITDNGDTYPLAVHDGDDHMPWNAYDNEDGACWLDAQSITSFKLAKVVEA